MKEVDLHNNVLKNDEVMVYLKTGVRFNGRSLAKNQDHRVPGWFARELYLSQRARPSTPKPKAQVPVEPEPKPEPVVDDVVEQAPRPFRKRRK